jgi:hypothetical protein
MNYHCCSDNKWYYEMDCEKSIKLAFFVIIAALYSLLNNLPRKENLRVQL